MKTMPSIEMAVATPRAGKLASKTALAEEAGAFSRLMRNDKDAKNASQAPDRDSHTIETRQAIGATRLEIRRLPELATTRRADARIDNTSNPAHDSGGEPAIEVSVSESGLKTEQQMPPVLPVQFVVRVDGPTPRIDRTDVDHGEAAPAETEGIGAKAIASPNGRAGEASPAERIPPKLTAGRDAVPDRPTQLIDGKDTAPLRSNGTTANISALQQPQTAAKSDILRTVVRKQKDDAPNAFENDSASAPSPTTSRVSTDREPLRTDAAARLPHSGASQTTPLQKAVITPSLHQPRPIELMPNVAASALDRRETTVSTPETGASPVDMRTGGADGAWSTGRAEGGAETRIEPRPAAADAEAVSSKSMVDNTGLKGDAVPGPSPKQTIAPNAALESRFPDANKLAAERSSTVVDPNVLTEKRTIEQPPATTRSTVEPRPPITTIASRADPVSTERPDVNVALNAASAEGARPAPAIEIAPSPVLRTPESRGAEKPADTPAASKPLSQPAAQTVAAIQISLAKMQPNDRALTQSTDAAAASMPGLTPSDGDRPVDNDRRAHGVEPTLPTTASTHQGASADREQPLSSAPPTASALPVAQVQRMPSFATEITMAAARYTLPVSHRDLNEPMPVSGPIAASDIADEARGEQPSQKAYKSALAPIGLQSEPVRLSAVGVEGTASAIPDETVAQRVSPKEPPRNAAETVEKPRQSPTSAAANTQNTALVATANVALAPSPASSVATAIASEPTWRPNPVAAATQSAMDRTIGSPKTLSVQLNPGGLGIVKATLSIAGKQLTVELAAETAEAHDRLRAESHTIEKAMNALGYETREITIVQSLVVSQAAQKSDGSPPQAMATARDLHSGSNGEAGGGRSANRNGDGQGHGGTSNSGGGAPRPAERSSGGVYI